MSKQQATNSDKPPIPDIVMDIPMTFERFPISNYVKVKYGLAVSGEGKVSGAHISGIPEDILKKLVDAFIAELYEKAGKKNPYIFFEGGEVQWVVGCDPNTFAPVIKPGEVRFNIAPTRNEGPVKVNGVATFP